MATVRLKGLGGWNEIGASSTLIQILENINENVLIDAGIRMRSRRVGHEWERWSEPPEEPNVPLKAVGITHGHADHVSWLSYILNKCRQAKVYMSVPTYHVSLQSFANQVNRIDSGRVKLEDDVEAAFFRGTRILTENQENFLKKPSWVEVCPGVRMYFGPNGHIRGSAFIVIEVDIGNGRYLRIMFTGDISVYDSPTVRGMKIPEEFIGNLDVIVTEATYGDRVLIPRWEEEARMGYIVTKTMEAGGICMAPAFGIGRSPDAYIAQLTHEGLTKAGPVYLDGQGQTFLDICADPEKGYWSELDHSSELDLNSKIIKYVRDGGHRKKLLASGGPLSVVATSGMMIKNTISYRYAASGHFLENPSNTVLYTGYTAEDTEGFELQSAVRQGRPYRVNGREVVVKASVPERLQLSSHADGPQIANIVNTLQPKRVIVVHGNQNGREGLKRELHKLGFRGQIDLPKNGDVLEV